jgi:WD40 repeat protein
VNPQIHVWDAQTMETIKILDTAHSGGVLHLIFSTDGQKLISIGMDRTFSIQVFNWEQKRSLAFRNSGYYPIFGVRFNPYDDSKFITCGYQHLAEWQLNGAHLSCVKFTNVYGAPGGGAPRELLDEKNLDDPRNKQKCILLCMDFISYRLGHSVQSDIVFGNNLGDISTYCSSKYFVLHEQAHPGAAINCIRVTNSLSLDLKTVCVITGGEDGMVKIWDASI